jgi:hypothetical protein
VRPLDGAFTPRFYSGSLLHRWANGEARHVPG